VGKNGDDTHTHRQNPIYIKYLAILNKSCYKLSEGGNKSNPLAK